MTEFDFTTQEGREDAKKYILEVVNKEDKTELGEILFSMMEFIVNNEVRFENIKNSI